MKTVVISVIKVWCLIFTLSLLCTLSSPADELKQPVLDSTAIDIRSISEESLQGFLGDDDFRYDRTTPKPEGSESILGIIYRRVMDFIFQDLLGSDGGTLLMYLVMIVVVLVVISLFTKAKFNRLLSGKGDEANVPVSEFEEDIHKMSLDDLIEEAVKQKQFRKAIRLHYLKVLRALSERNLIKWKIDKTNSDYARELGEPELHEPFVSVSRLFEFIWYGDVPIDESDFLRVREEFTQFNRLVGRVV